MPTPSDNTFQLSSRHLERSTHITCPPDYERPIEGTELWRALAERPDEDVLFGGQSTHRPILLPDDAEMTGLSNHHDHNDHAKESKFDDAGYSLLSSSASSPRTVQAEPKEARDARECHSPSPLPSIRGSTVPSSTGYEFSSVRQIPNYSSSFLRAGSKFRGTQTSDRQTYNVEVDIKHVDMNESFLCGYLRIEGLTEDHPTLTTYFEGEIVGSKYTFQTKHESWGATDKTDNQHWNRFPAWRPLTKQARSPDFHYKNCAQRENIFMRWKEYFLVPDHRVREIMGASFEGFYYICFNQVAGTVSGIYFHAKSEKFQALELAHVETRGCYASTEFR